MKATLLGVGVGVLALAFSGCMPDFDSLTVGKKLAVCSGDACGGSGSTSIGGDSSNNGGSSAGVLAGGGSSTQGGDLGAAGAGAESGSAGESGAAGGSTAGKSGSGGSGGANNGGAFSGSGGAGGGSGGSGGKAGAGGSAGSAGAGPCVTKFTGAAGPGVVKFSFDTPGSAVSGVNLYPEDPTGHGATCTGPISKSSSTFNPTEGHMCPGALELTAPFGVYAPPYNQITIVVNFPSSDWTPYSLLHAWVKIKTPDATVPGTETLSYLSSYQFSTASSSTKGGNSYDNFLGSTQPLSGFADRAWHEITLGLPTPPNGSYFSGAVLDVGLQIQSVGTKPGTPADAPDAPPTTVVEIDDIWVE